MVFEELFQNERHERTESNYISKNKPLIKDYNYSFRSFILAKIKFENLSNAGALFWLAPDQTRLLIDDKEQFFVLNLFFQISILGRYQKIIFNKKRRTVLILITVPIFIIYRYLSLFQSLQIFLGFRYIFVLNLQTTENNLNSSITSTSLCCDILHFLLA